MKKCPYCTKEVLDEAIKCRYCKKTLNYNARENLDHFLGRSKMKSAV